MQNSNHKYLRSAGFIGVLLISTLIFTSCAGGPSPREVEGEAQPEQRSVTSNYRETIVSLLETFDALLVSSDSRNELKQLYEEVRKAFPRGVIQFRADTDPLKNSLRRSRFTIDPSSGNAVILIHHSLLEQASENPVPAMSEIAGNIARIGDYIEHGEEIAQLYSDPLEFYLANMNSIYLQAVFLRDIAIPVYGDESLTEFDNYLLQSLTVDSFSSMSLFVWGLDKDIIYSMLGLSTQLSKGGVSKDDYVGHVLELGREVRNNMEQSRRLFDESGEGRGDDRSVARRTMYIAATSARTYRTLGSVIFTTVVNNRFSQNEYLQYEAEIEEINQIYSLLETLLNEVNDFRKEYRSEYLQGF